jgi:uncharacterized protein YndB with AHSA1/START domain
MNYKITSEAVVKATGKNWDEWVKIIDKEGGDKMSHKEIARMLYDKGYVKSGWWCQSVTVGYEYAKGRRSVGETNSQGVEIGVSKTFNVGSEKLWDLVFSNEGLKFWLGGLSDFVLEPEFVFQTSNGTKGEIRTLKKGERIRMSFHPKEFEKPSTLQLYFEKTGEDKTRLGFHQEKLKDIKTREQMKKHWEKVLEELYNLSNV